MGKIKGWKRDWNIGNEYPEWVSVKGNVMTIFEGDTPSIYSVAVGRNRTTRYLGKNITKKQALAYAMNYMRGNPNG